MRKQIILMGYLSFIRDRATHSALANFFGDYFVYNPVTSPQIKKEKE